MAKQLEDKQQPAGKKGGRAGKTKNVLSIGDTLLAKGWDETCQCGGMHGMSGQRMKMTRVKNIPSLIGVLSRRLYCLAKQLDP